LFVCLFAVLFKNLKSRKTFVIDRSSSNDTAFGYC
jgi:hypothetical protein